MAAIIIKEGIAHMDIKEIHHFLAKESYWAKGISLELVDKFLQHSYCVGAFTENRQVGFSRMITDYATFGWLADVYVLPEFRGQGISKKMPSHLSGLPWMQGLRRIMLNTSDAQELYRRFGFSDLAHPERILEITRPGIYIKK